nr:hypothetical protein [Tanacetum cinerariifolium]
MVGEVLTVLICGLLGEELWLNLDIIERDVLMCNDLNNTINYSGWCSMASTRYFKDESCWNADVKSKTTEDIISNRSFMEALVLNHYVLVKNVLFSRLMNSIERNKVLPNKIAINTKFLNSLQPEWSIYGMIVLQSQQLHEVEYDLLYAYLSQNELNMNALRAKGAARKRDPLTLVANTYASPSYSQNAGRVAENQGKNVGNGFVQKYVGSANNVKRIP